MERKSTEERREEIVDALLRVMADQGYAKATIQRIADEAGLTAGLIHYHFKSKQEILLALLEQLTELQASRNDAWVNPGADPTERVRSVVLSFLRVGQKADPEAVSSWVTITAEAIRQSEVRDAYAGAIETLRLPLVDAVGDGIESGEFDTGGLSPEACGAAIIASLQGYYNLGVSAREVVPRGSAAPALLRMVAGLLRVKDYEAFVELPE